MFLLPASILEDISTFCLKSLGFLFYYILFLTMTGKTSIERHMMDEKIDAVDQISDLPEMIMHHTLSFLPRKDVAKTSLLSKKWNCVWCSFPILGFDQTCYLDFDRFLFCNTQN